jgi:hypothetical protein
MSVSVFSEVKIVTAYFILFSLFRCKCVVRLKFSRIDGLDCASRPRIFRLGDLNLGRFNLIQFPLVKVHDHNLGLPQVMLG